MKIYVAAPYGKKEQAQIAANELAQNGHFITSRWHKDSGDKPPAEECYIDLLDIECSDCVLALFGKEGRGKWIECGYALAKGKHVILVDEENTLAEVTIFQHHLNWTTVQDLDEAIDYLFFK